MSESIFLQLKLPNAATWSYFSLLLTIAFFFQFSRMLVLRNWDLLSLFLFTPGFLLIQEANEIRAFDPAHGETERFYGYVWLLSASAYWLVRCFFDMTVNRRPSFRSNLTSAGLIWFGIMLFIGLTSVALRRPAPPTQPVGKQPVAIKTVKDSAAAVVSQASSPDNPAASEEIRSWVERSLTMTCHLSVVLGLFFVGWKHFREADTGAAMATLYLLLPYTAFHIDQLHHVLPASLTVWAVFAYRHPRISGWLLGFAAGASFFPFLVVPIWIHFYWKRGAWSFLTRFLLAAAISFAITLGVLWAAGTFPDGVTRGALNLTDWQPWTKPTAESVWQGVHWAYRLPVFIVFAVWMFSSLFWPPVRNVSQAVAYSAAILIGVQFWYSDRGGLYVLWYAPLLLMLVFRPTSTELEPPPPNPESGWGTRLAAAAWRKVVRGSPQSQPHPPTLAA